MPLSPQDLKDVHDIIASPILQRLDERLKDFREIVNAGHAQQQTILDNHEKRIGKVEKNQVKVLAMWGIIFGAISLLWNILVEKFLRWIGWK